MIWLYIAKLDFIPLGYDKRASEAFPPSPQLSRSPGKHLSPVPITLAQLLQQ